MRGRDRINQILPDELIIDIFRHLESKPSRDACALVCKRWLRLERLSRLTLRIGASGCPDALVNLLAHRFVNVRNVFVDERLSNSLPVQHGRRRGADHSVISSLMNHSLAETNGSEDNETESYFLSDAGLAAVAAGFTKLEKLSLIWCSNVTHVGLRSIAEKCILLKSLDLQGCYVGDQDLAAVGEFSKQLEDLNLRFCEGITDAGLIKLVAGSGKTLKSISLAACAKVTDTSLEAVAVGCAGLTHLEVNGCHNIGTYGLESIARSCMHLTELALLHCQRIGNFALSEIGRGCKFLQALHLVDCASIGDEAICSIARGCCNLKRLHIHRCHEVGNMGIIAVGENCKFLTDLSLRFCDRVGDEALVAIGEGCSLHHLNVRGCHQIGDAGIIAVARGCPELSYLDVSLLQDLGNMAIVELGEGCPLLRDIALILCRQITDVGLSYLANKCTLLETCHMECCPGITAAGVATVITSCTNIKEVLVENWKVSPRTKRRAGSIISSLLYKVKADCRCG